MGTPRGTTSVRTFGQSVRGGPEGRPCRGEQQRRGQCSGTAQEQHRSSTGKQGPYTVRVCSSVLAGGRAVHCVLARSASVRLRLEARELLEAVVAVGGHALVWQASSGLWYDRLIQPAETRGYREEDSGIVTVEFAGGKDSARQYRPTLDVTGGGSTSKTSSPASNGLLADTKRPRSALRCKRTAVTFD
eukprot:2586893-Pyramimonas_sp.AAC.2